MTLVVITAERVRGIYVEQIAAGLLRDPGALEGAVAAPFQTPFGHNPYPTIAQKAGKLLDGIQRVQAYTDGNKRLAWLSSVAFLSLNCQYVVDTSQEEVDEFVRSLAGAEAPEIRAAVWFNDRLAGAN
ncbi:type II toxin-antitoxin system death-on-curing family toxin [Terrabacter sp. C0L_2]|uniref:type II toxin-antitoxin system death-on-curing family toxin n=1 Tax=Terrabacter sp. C0L_2 TaxID=3108389 RepID=UPI002ED12F34|nr:Fic family protein [Terrabacter sp. C0L_2]